MEATKGKTKAKGKAEAETHQCFHCQSEGAKMMCCSQCHRAWYCGKACQKKHWKQHKRACVAAVASSARRATRRREVTAAAATQGGGKVDKETCVICIGPVVEPVELPCGHVYCDNCLSELRAKGVAQTCPQCREELPPGVDGLFKLAYLVLTRIYGQVKRGELSFESGSLPPETQTELDEAMAMMTEAADQGHLEAFYYVGVAYDQGLGVAQSYATAERYYKVRSPFG